MTPQEITVRISKKPILYELRSLFYGNMTNWVNLIEENKK